MASGKRHNQASLLLSFVSFGITAHFTNQPDISLVCSLGTLSGIFLTPDLDVLPTVDKEKFKRRTPMLWRWFWFPYADIIKHRAVVSHLPILSTTIRLIYAFLPIIVIANIAGVNLQLFDKMIIWYFIGLCVSDTAHWIMDGCPVR